MKKTKLSSWVHRSWNTKRAIEQKEIRAQIIQLIKSKKKLFKTYDIKKINLEIEKRKQVLYN